MPFPIPPRNTGFGIDYGLGVDPLHIQYIRDNHLIQSRISPTPCYLLQRQQQGLPVGYKTTRITALDSQFTTVDGQSSFLLWLGGSSNKPDTRPYTNNNQGSIGVYYQNQQMTRVLTPTDITTSMEFAVVEDKTTSPPSVKVVFQTGLDVLGGKIAYYYTTIEPGVEDLTVQRGDSTDQSIFGWKQYLNSYEDDFQMQNQVLVRFPINLHDVIISDEGKVILENRDSWMIWTPYLNDFDVLVLSKENSPDGIEYRYEIVNSTDSIIQGQLISQRFKLNLLEFLDDRYKIPYVTIA